MKRLAVGLMAMLMVTPAMASGIPVSCTEGSRTEPQPPTIIPAWTEITPDIQHDGWIEEVPDIFHPAEYKNVSFAGSEVGVTYNGPTLSKFCTPEYAGTGYQRPEGFCTQMARTTTLALTTNSFNKDVLVAAEYIQDVPDIEHAPYVEDVPDIEHPEQSIPNPDLIIPTRTITTLVITGPWWNPGVTYQSHTQDGTCPPGL